MSFQIINKNCLDVLRNREIKKEIDLTFLDPPFNQGKDYNFHQDDMDDEKYWVMMKEVCEMTYEITSPGGAVYFMQREKNTENVLKVIRETKWSFQNLIVWKKKTSAVPGVNRYGKQYQIIVFATKGERPRLFNRLRISPPLPPNYKYQRDNGIFLTDIWDDIRELTSGYFAGNEAIRNENGERLHKQQSPISLLLRILLSSTKVGDLVFDPFAGTGTALVTALQLQRNAIGIEVDPLNVKCIKDRLNVVRDSDLVDKYYKDYSFTENLSQIWGDNLENIEQNPALRYRNFNLFGEQ